ncbi:hypothetical protein JG687_00005366 [Phytophthora cactorum]|uniref:Uncharacterized protein n=1 Tax=Phytophthora cactorum TaxID=29920 RepID=A0A8T1UQT6_9STRA|nr:hypothetical protein JG687_00005366 [Phytophthora cactorum]
MDGRLKSRPRTLSPDAVATGTALRTREQARLELLQASDRENAANYSPRDESSTDMDMDGCERLNSSGDTGGGGEGNQFPNMFEQSRMYVDQDELLKLRRRPPVAFVVRNTATKEEELQAAVTTRGTAVFRPTKRGQSWHSPVHVPLSHRKLVQPPEIFREDPPFRPIAPRAPTGAKTGRWRDKPGNLLGRTTHNTTKLTPMPSPALEARDQLSDRSFVRNLREKNKELFDRLVQRFATLRRVSIQELESHDNTDNNVPINMKLSGVEDAILFFLDAKHKHDVLYFKRKNARGAKSTETAKLSLGWSSASAPTGKYMPYDLERIDEAPRSGAGDYFMMTSSSLVHHTNNNDNGVSGEVIPLSQWIMESKMFSLLLAGIPLFQKFLVRKTFVGWVRAIRRTIYRDNCKRIARCLPFARPSFVRSMLLSSRALRDIQQIRSLTLPTTRPAVDLVTVQEHQKEHLAMAEMRLIDAKEKLLGLMEEMVQKIYDDLDPPTNLDELYNAEAASVRTVNAKWKSAPIAAMRQRKTDLQRQKDAAVLDMSLLETYIRMLDYMFTEMAIVGDSLELTPSLDQTKHIFLDGIARLIRLVSNFHFTKNATTEENEEDDATASSLQAGVDIDAIYGIAEGEELPIKPLRVSANPQLWMKELDERNAEWSVDSCTLLEQVSGSSRSKSLPPLTVYATTRFRSASEGLMLPSSTSTETMTNLSFYRCPLYQSPDHVAALETPLEYVFLPIPVDQNAGAMVVQGAALLLQQFE